MSMNDTPSSDRVHIGFFGRRNAGKSSLVNAVTGQELAVVSEIRGTTTDPVKKAMELLPLGPVVIIDTPGIDDEGTLGEMRVRKAKQVLNRTDVAVLVTDGTEGRNSVDEELIALFQSKEIPYLIAYNKADLCETLPALRDPAHEIWVSARTGGGIHELKDRIARLSLREEPRKRLVGDLLQPSDFVVLVVPIDKAAPKGRLILPTRYLRVAAAADNPGHSGGRCGIHRGKRNGTEKHPEPSGRKPRMVITDSQGIRPGRRGHAVRHLADLFFHSVCPVQGESAPGCRRRSRAGQPAG